MNKLVLTAAAALTAGIFGAAAIAQDTVTDFDKADANKDKSVSWDEALGVYPTLSQVLFDQADGNDDGVLDDAEFTALQGLTAGLDTNTSSSESSSAPAP